MSIFPWWALVACVAVPALAAPLEAAGPADAQAATPALQYVSVFRAQSAETKQSPDQRWLAWNAQVAQGGMAGMAGMAPAVPTTLPAAKVASRPVPSSPVPAAAAEQPESQHQPQHQQQHQHQGH